MRTGEIAYFTKLKAEFPPTLFELFELQGLGPKKIRAAVGEAGVTSLAELEAACKDGRVAALKGFGKKTADNVLKAIQDRAQHAGSFRLGDIAPGARVLLEELRDLPEVSQACIAGSYRRCKEIVRDLDYIVATREPAAVSEFFMQHPLVERRARARSDEIERAPAERHPGRFARGDERAVPFCARLLHRLEGAQHRHPQPRPRAAAGR